MGYLFHNNYTAVTEENVEDHIEHIVNWIKTYFVRNGADSKAVIGISGGKDSTIAAALLVRALGVDKVIGVLMPQGTQSDIDDSRRVVNALGIKSVEINIGSAVSELYHAIDLGWDYDHKVENDPMVSTNTPARIRMTTLYAVAALVGGRVCNNSNMSETYVGYSTKFGDGAGDFAPLAGYTVRDLMTIGDALDEIDNDLIHKDPADGMCGKTDEDNLGFTYDMLDSYILDDVIPPYDQFKQIELMHARSLHKTKDMPKCRRWDDRDLYLSF